MKITTDRLEIRTFEFGDWPSFKRIPQDFQASEYRYYDHESPTDDEKVQEAAKYFASTGLWFSVFPKGSDEMIGYVCFHAESDFLDMGYCFHSSAHGKGYAFEACRALMEHLAQTREFRGFTAGTALDNQPSVKLLGKLGFQLTGAETVCFYEGRPFTGGSFVRRI